ncbi:MAG: c-type cytochrome [Rhodocyclaceae bacterium]|nr:c-type cytochrome [Rhodocyclaceae bacterium]
MRCAGLIAIACLASLADPAGAAGRDPLAIVEARCQNCHGMTGQSSSPNYPKLASQNAQYLQRQLFNFKSGKRQNAEMQAQVADLTGAEIEALADYFSGKAVIADVAFDPALADIGRLLYENGNTANGVTACSACHGPRAHGALFLPRLAGQHASYIERQIKAFIDHTREAPDIVMHTVVAGLTEAEIIAVAQYLSGLD